MSNDIKVQPYTGPRDLRVIGQVQRDLTTGVIKPAISASDMVFDLLRDNYQLADSTPFFKTGTINAGVTEASIVSFTMPDGMKGVLKFVGHGAKTVDAFSFATWRILKNGVAVPDFGSFTFQIGSISSPKPVTIRMNSGDTVDFRVVTSAGIYEVYALLEGWYWTMQS